MIRNMDGPEGTIVATRLIGTTRRQSTVINTENNCVKNNNGKVYETVLLDTPTATTSTGVDFTRTSTAESSLLGMGQECAPVQISWKQIVTKLITIFCLLYSFVCSLGLLSDGFRLIAGRAAGEVLQKDKLISNPIVGLMMGILVTVAVQSSSTSTSIVVSMVSSGLFPVRTAIPIIMGANVGTSVTNTVVALTHMSNRHDFERAFAGAVLHDMFNLLTVTTLLSIEQLTQYLEITTTKLLNSFDWKEAQNSNSSSKGSEIQGLSALTKPLTNLVVQIDKEVILGWSIKDPKYDNATLLKTWCNKTVNADPKKCKFLLNGLSDKSAGIILLVVSVGLLCGCLILLVRTLSTLLRGKLALAVQRAVNADVPGFPWLTGYFAILIGAIMTVLVQSSSVFTSAMTPLIALGMISLERAYPLTLGSNLGTTTTAMLAALASSGPNLKYSIQISLCHFLFNLTGILLFYPIPSTRFPIQMSACLGSVTAKYRWFAVVYLIQMFLLLPLLVFGISLCGPIVMYITFLTIGSLITFILILNFMQQKYPANLPQVLKTFGFLPIWLRSLEPYDKIVQALLKKVQRRKTHQEEEGRTVLNSSANNNSLGIDNDAFCIRQTQV